MQADMNLIETKDELKVPWALREIVFATIGVIVLSLAVIFATQFWGLSTNIVLIVYELVYLIPVLAIVLLKKAKWEVLGLRRFSLENLAIGCGMLFMTYIIIMIHNLALMGLGIAPQGEYIAEIFGMDIDLWVLGISVMVVAPITEEIFFRSFVFGGLTEKYGWKKATFISAFVFGAAHMQLVAFIPTFLMGLVLAYLYQRSKSVFPGIILHFTVNAFGFLMIYLSTLLPESLPYV